jgi:hypothetical protein
MTSIINTFLNKDKNKDKDKDKDTKISSSPSPSLNQGKKFKKYQTKIKNSLEKKANIVAGKEGFTSVDEENSLTFQTQNIIKNNNYSNDKSIIDNLRQEYNSALQEYETLIQKFSSNLNGYIERVSPNNPYLNKIIKFTSGETCYITSQGVAKYIPSTDILNSINIPKNYIDINIPWTDSYQIPGTQIPTNPPLVVGTNLEMGQSIGNEGSNVFVNQLLPPTTSPTYMNCYAANSNNDNMTFIGGNPSSLKDVSIQNGTFSQPIIENNSFTYITSASKVPNWYFEGAVLLNNSSAWGYPMPYPSGNQCVSIQNSSYINTQLALNSGVTYTLTFSACSRNCCKNPNIGNPINIQLYTNLNAYISQISNFTAPINSWKTYSYTFTVPTSQTYKIYFSGTNSSGDQSTALANIALNYNGSTSSQGSYTYQDCQQTAINNGYRYFGLQNVNKSNRKGYCAVSNSQPAVSQYGLSTIPSKLVMLWSSNTPDQPGNTAILTNTGSLQVLNSSGQSVYSSPATNANPSNYLGCYNDCSKGRGLPTYLGNGKTYDTCQADAEAGNWDYFGLQYIQPNGTSQCWVGNDITQGMSMGKANNCTVLNGVNVGGSCSNAIYNNSTESSNYFLTLQSDGNMCIYRGTNPNDNQGNIWSTETTGKEQSSNPDVIASKGKYGKSWMPSGSTLASGDFLGSDDGKLALVMQSDGNLVLYTYQMYTNCEKMSDGTMAGGVGANAVYDIGLTSINNNVGKMGFIDENSNLYTYPSSDQQYKNTYSTQIKGMDTLSNDIPDGAFTNTTIKSCETACNNNSDCAGFVANTAGNSCWLKTSSMYPYGGKSSANSNLNIYIRDKQPSSPPLGVSQNTNNIDTIKYQNYINKGNITSDYGLANMSSIQKQQLEQLQNKINVLSQQITDSTNKFQGGAYSAERQTKINASGIDGYLTTLTDTNTKITNASGENGGNINNILKDSDIVVLKKNYDYLFWSILAAGTVLISINIVKK